MAIPGLALADANISGQWRANLGHGVIINMDVLADGHWASQTIQDSKVVAEMAGTYEQTAKTDTTGHITWTPLKSKVTADHADASIESDDYVLGKDGKTLKLTTADGRTMVFHNYTVRE